MDTRWTIRGISPEARSLMERLHAATGVPYGRLVSLAIRHWYSQLPPEGLLLQVMKPAPTDQALQH